MKGNLKTAKIWRNISMVVTTSAAILVIYERFYGFNQEILSILVYILLVLFIALSIVFYLLVKAFQKYETESKYFVRDRDFTNEWIKRSLNEARINETTKKLHIDSMAIQSTTLRSICATKIINGEMRPFIMRSMIIEKDSEGEKFREYMEGKKPGALKSKLENANSSWREFKDLVSDKSKDSEVEVKETNLPLPYYIIRVGNVMMISPYVARRGYMSSYELIDKSENPKLFNQYLEFLDKFFKSDIFLKNI